MSPSAPTQQSDAALSGDTAEAMPMLSGRARGRFLGSLTVQALLILIATRLVLAWCGWPRDVLILVSTLVLAMLTILFGHGFWVV